MSYKENVERYRLQLWRNIIRENIGYPFRGNTAKALLMNKLLKYSYMAGVNHNDAFDGKLVESDILLGWAGKKLKDKMRARNSIHLGTKKAKVRRSVARHMFQYERILSNLKLMQAFPDAPLTGVVIVDVQQVIFVRNGSVGELRFVDGDFNDHVFPWTVDKNKTIEEVHDAWTAVGKVTSVGYGIAPEVKPFFPKRAPGAFKHRTV